MSDSPPWLSRGDNAWQLIAATLVGLQCNPGLVLIYGGIMKKKWAVNSSFMAVYAFAVVMLCWVTWAYEFGFGSAQGTDIAGGFWGRPDTDLDNISGMKQSSLPAAGILPAFPKTTMILLGALLARINVYAWMIFVPLWVTLGYTVGSYSLFAGGFLFRWGVIDYSGGYVIHLSAAAAGYTAAAFVGPRLARDRAVNTPNNTIVILFGAGFLWLGWSGFNGGDPYAASMDASVAVLNTHVATATSVVVWTLLDNLYYGKSAVIGALKGMITGLVAITPGAGVVTGWGALIVGFFSGSVPWVTLNLVKKNLRILQVVDDTLDIAHTHGVAGLLGGILVGFLASAPLCRSFGCKPGTVGLICGGLFIILWNVFITSVIMLAISCILPLRMSEEALAWGDDAVHGEEAYALWGDGDLIAPPGSEGLYGYDHTHHGPESL
eukprot:SM000080S22944  [mRNA]  locus=s80:221900:225468:- [translate_table: standard]